MSSEHEEKRRSQKSLWDGLSHTEEKGSTKIPREIRSQGPAARAEQENPGAG